MNEALLVAVVGAFLALLSHAIRTGVRDHRRKQAVTRAILSEVHRLIGVIDDHVKWWRSKVEANDRNTPLIPFSTDVYDRLVENLQIMGPDVIQDVVQYYGYIRFINSFQGTRQSHNNSGMADEFNEAYLQMLERLQTEYGRSRFDHHFQRNEIRVEQPLEGQPATQLASPEASAKSSDVGEPEPQ